MSGMPCARCLGDEAHRNDMLDMLLHVWEREVPVILSSPCMTMSVTYVVCATRRRIAVHLAQGKSYSRSWVDISKSGIIERLFTEARRESIPF
jgi:hypothetical protein